eukprot:6447747-Prymnesium_polylepis.1
MICAGCRARHEGGQRVERQGPAGLCAGRRRRCPGAARDPAAARPLRRQSRPGVKKSVPFAHVDRRMKLNLLRLLHTRMQTTAQGDRGPVWPPACVMVRLHHA